MGLYSSIRIHFLQWIIRMVEENGDKESLFVEYEEYDNVRIDRLKEAIVKDRSDVKS